IIRIQQLIAKSFTRLSSFLFNLPPLPDVSKITPANAEKYYYNIAKKRLPDIPIDEVSILGFFIYTEEKLSCFKELFKTNQFDKFIYNEAGFDPCQDYACVLKVISKNDIYIVIDVQYYDFSKQEKLVFLEKTNFKID
ncbi:MAG: hypothetical protein JNL24_11710, partial [Bacteroidia bacterium]|nr:hypothetical protein [Bacteroidia bacterium]